MNYNIKNGLRIVNIIGLLLSLGSCNSKITRNQLKGKYFQQEDKTCMLTLEDKSFSISSLRSHHPTYICCDTLTKGNWYLRNDKLIVLDNQLSLSNHVQSEAHESIREMKDSFYIYIINPVETDTKREGWRTRKICYRAYVTKGDDEAILDTLVNSDSIRLFNTHSIKSITLLIYTTPYFLGRYNAEDFFITTEYELKSRQTNILFIEMPKLTYEYMTYIRIKQDFVRIANKNCLEWHGNKYFKE
jgi:hypothetical protein